MADLPTGRVTFLFTDIEGSTRMLAALGDAFPAQLEAHNAILRDAIRAAGGLELTTHGDAFFAVFTEPARALAAAVDAQRRLDGSRWAHGWPVRVRMGLHTGEATVGGDNYVGLTVHRAARIADAAHGGQVLLSAPTADEVRDALPDGVGLRELGEHWLRDLDHPEPLAQLLIDGLASDFPPLRTASRGPTSLPAELSSFIGRDAERQAVARHLDEARLLTLVGPGGSGKTRLALRVAGEYGVRLPDGAAFVPLEAVTDPELLPSAVAVAIGLHVDAAEPVAAAVASQLRTRHMLLVLDNTEQLADVGRFVATLLGEAPQLRVLVTSRMPLHVPGERILEVPPLAVPDPAHLPDPAALERFDSVALFVARARDAEPGFALDPANAPAVAAICARLDGLPLAIELAAARIRILSPAAILARLERPLAALGAGGTSASERQRTLRGAITWSHDLLGPAERALFRRLAVCAGGCDLEAAQAVAGAVGGDVIDALSSLVDKSLLRRLDRAGEPQFAMLATIREFAAERLAEDPAEERAALRRHAAHWLAIAERQAPQANRASDAALRLAADQENLRAALRFTLSPGATPEEARTGLALASALGPYWMIAAPREGSQWLEQAIERFAAVKERDAALEGRISFYCGALLEAQGRAGEAEAHLEAGLASFRAVGDRRWQARLLNSLGAVARAHGERARARELLGESLGLATELGVEGQLAAVLSNLGLVDVDEGDLDAARDHFRQSLEADRRSGNQDGIATGMTNLADVALRAGDIVGAEALVAESLPLFLRLGDLLGVAGDLEHAAEAAAARGNHLRAARLTGSAEALRRQEGLEMAMVEADRYRAIVAGVRAALGEAAFDEAYRAGSLLGHEAAVREALDGLGSR